MKQQLNLRVSALTLDQLKKLAERWGTSQTETITVLIDRAYQSETGKKYDIRNLQDTELEKR